MILYPTTEVKPTSTIGDVKSALNELLNRHHSQAAVVAIDDSTGDVYELIGVELIKPEAATVRSTQPDPMVILRMVRQ